MSEIKPGTRVRVTTVIEGRYQRRIGDVVVTEDSGAEHIYNYNLDGDRYSTVEVLASPVYVNHDTTEYRVGDVVRDADACVVVRLPGTSWIDTEDGGRVRDTYLTPPLTLLVRDGQVIAP